MGIIILVEYTFYVIVMKVLSKYFPGIKFKNFIQVMFVSVILLFIQLSFSIIPFLNKFILSIDDSFIVFSAGLLILNTIVLIIMNSILPSFYAKNILSLALFSFVFWMILFISPMHMLGYFAAAVFG